MNTGIVVGIGHDAVFRENRAFLNYFAVDLSCLSWLSQEGTELSWLGAKLRVEKGIVSSNW